MQEVKRNFWGIREQNPVPPKSEYNQAIDDVMIMVAKLQAEQRTKMLEARAAEKTLSEATWDGRSHICGTIITMLDHLRKY